MVEAPLTWRPTRNEAVTCSRVQPPMVQPTANSLHLFPVITRPRQHLLALALNLIFKHPYYGRPSPLHCDLWNTPTARFGMT